MAEFTLKVGNVTATRTYADNAKVANVLGKFADHYGVDPDLPAQERLEVTIDEIVRLVVERARAQHIKEVADAAVSEAEDIGMS